MTAHGQFQSTAHGYAVQRRDHRFGRGLHCGDQFARVGRDGGLGGVEFADLGAGAKRPPATDQHDGLYRRIGDGALQRVKHTTAQGMRQCVHRRIVEADHRNTVGNAGLYHRRRSRGRAVQCCRAAPAQQQLVLAFEQQFATLVVDTQRQTQQAALGALGLDCQHLDFPM